MEFVGTLPLLVLGALACVQALLVACSLLFAQAAADRAARGSTARQALSVMPSGWRDRAALARADQTATVTVRPPAVLPGAARLLRVSASSSEVGK